MNCVQLIGRLVADPDVRYTNGGLSVAKFRVACDRRYKKEGNEQTADFISCVAFGKTAEFIEKYFSKGKRIALEGRIQTGSYEKEDGSKIYTTDVVVENVEFVESANASTKGDKKATDKADDFMDIPAGLEDELPFA